MRIIGHNYEQFILIPTLSPQVNRTVSFIIRNTVPYSSRYIDLFANLQSIAHSGLAHGSQRNAAGFAYGEVVQLSS